MASATTYNIELRDKNGNLIQYLTPFVSKVNWEWNRIGGCGKCKLTIKKLYRSIEFTGDEDIQIRLKSGSTSKLVYRGYVRTVTPRLASTQDIVLDVRGYFDKLAGYIVESSGDKKTYENQAISTIVDDVVDTFIVAKSNITKGTIDTSSFSADRLDFKTSVKEVLKTCSDLLGDVEYGVDEDLVFFWRTESSTLRHKFFVGDNVSTFERKIDYSKIINKYVFQGGNTVSSLNTPLLQTAIAVDSQTQYFVSEALLSNSSITTQPTADQILGASLKQNSKPVLILKCRIPNTDLRLEDTLPIGEIAVFDADHDQNSTIIGEVGDGGSDVTIGLTDDGGDNITVGGFYSEQVRRLKYSMSDTDEKFTLDIEIGDAVDATAAKIKQIELLLSSVRQT